MCLPLTDETHGLIGAKERALLPRSAVLVKVARGPPVEEAALYAALKAGALLGAGLDVLYNYPKGESEYANTPPSAFPFHEPQSLRPGDSAMFARPVAWERVK